MRSDSDLHVTIVEEVADLKNTEPANLPPLHDVIDPDVLDTLFAGGSREPLSLQFTYADCFVSVHVRRETVVTVQHAPSRNGAGRSPGQRP